MGTENNEGNCTENFERTVQKITMGTIGTENKEGDDRYRK